MQLSTVLVEGQTYKVSAWFYVVSGNAFLNPSDTYALNTTYGRTTTTGEWEYLVFYFKAKSSTTSGEWLYITDGSTNASTFYVDDISVKAVNKKNNATTVFYGDELITDTENRDFSSASNWTNRAMGTAWTTYDESASSGATEGDYFTDNYLHLAVTSDASNNKGAYLDGAEFETGMFPGRTYRLSYSMHITAHTSGILSVGLASASHSMSTSAVSYNSTESAGTYNLDFVYDGTTNHAEIMINASTSSAFTVYFDNFSLKEVGTATGWTDSDQQLDIPQTALQSYNQLAWFDGAADYVSIADHNDFSFGDETNDSAFSLSSWIFVNEATHFPIMGKNSSSHREWLLYIDQNDKLAMLLLDNSSGANQGRYYNATWPHTGKWAHVSATYDGNEADADAGLKLYINGERVDDQNTTSGSYTAMENKDGVVTIGASLNGANYADGAITESCIWNKELSQAEVIELYNDGLALDATTHSASSNLIGYWRNNGLATWQDLTSNNRDGTPTSVTETMLITAGADSSRDSQGFLMNKQRTTNSLNLPSGTEADLVPGYAKVNNNDTIKLTGSYTIAAWVKLPLTGDDYQRILALETGANGANGYGMYVHTNGKVFNACNNDSQASSSAQVTANTWTYITVTADGTDKKIYVNGAQTDTETNANDAAATTADLFIGKSNGVSDRQVSGVIDDVVLYNTALTASEILRNYNAGKRSHK